MMTKQKRNFFCCALMTVAMLFMFLVLAPFNLADKTASAEKVYESALVGDVIEAKDYMISKDDANIAAEGMTVVYPSGGVYGGDKIALSQAGEYQVTYYATVDGERVEETCYYMVTRMPKDVIVTEEGMSVEQGKYYVESPYELKQDTYGAIVTFKAGQHITFSTNIKTCNLTADYNILELIVMPSVFKETDFERLSIRISDAEDAENYVDIIVITSNVVDGDGQVSYVQAGANGQIIGGYEGATYHSNSALYGTQVEHSFRALGRKGEFRSNHTISENYLTVSIDHEEKKVYCGPYSNESTSKVLVNDLDGVANYKSNPWGGFTSDEVTVRITADRFIKPEGKVLIKSFGDLDFSTDIIDTVAPEILVEAEKSEGLPIAEVGKDFPIFPYIARDLLDAELKTNVLVYYVDDQGQKIAVENDGETFFAKYAGKYQIVYRAEDYSGNKTEKILEISAQETMPNLYIAIEEPLVQADVYQTVTIPFASQVQAFGGSGYLSVDRNVYNPKGQKLEVEDTLQLTMLGNYKVMFSVTDYLGNVAYAAMTVSVNPLTKPTFIQEPTFDSAFIKDFIYELPQVLVVETVNGQIIELPYQVYINDKLVESTFEAKGETMNVRYVVNGETGVAEWSRDISVVDTEYGKYKSRYFYSESGMQILDEKLYVDFRFSENSSVEFVNPLYADGFSLILSYEAEQVNFSTMKLTLTNASDLTQSVTVGFFYDKVIDAWLMQLNGVKSKISYAMSKGILSFALSSDGKRIIDTDGVEIAEIIVYDNGKPFHGLGEELYLQISFEEVIGESSFHVTQIGNQAMGYNKSSIDKAMDEIKPVIILDEAFITRQKLGSKAKIPTAKAYDVLGQIYDFTVTLEMVGGQVLASGSAEETLDVVLEKAGNYLVTYYAKDANGNKTRLPYSIFVSDETAPTLNVKGELKGEYKLGSKIEIPSYSASDNGSNCYVQVTLILPNNEMRLLQYNENGEITSLLTKDSDLYETAFKSDENTFVALYEGKYTLRIVAYDEYYNYTVREIEFWVK